LTAFLPEHPGGSKIIMKYAGKDATSAFEPIHPPDIIERLLPPQVWKGAVDSVALAKVPVEETEEDKKVRLAREQMPRLSEMYNSFDFESKCVFNFFFFFYTRLSPSEKKKQTKTKN
jgi:L-lactate dehydrogenase (cytochrome)